jgi:matrixin
VRILLICLLFSISFIACYLPRSPFYPGTRELHKTVYLDEHLSVFERKEIRAALAEWSCATENIMTFEIVEGTAGAATNKRHAIIIKDVLHTEPIVVKSNEDRKDILHTIGLSTVEDGMRTIMVVKDAAYNWEYRAIIIHEVGHAVAMLAHSDVEDSIMFPNMSLAAMHLTQDDINAFCANFECELTLKSECASGE